VRARIVTAAHAVMAVTTDLHAAFRWPRQAAVAYAAAASCPPDVEAEAFPGLNAVNSRIGSKYAVNLVILSLVIQLEPLDDIDLELLAGGQADALDVDECGSLVLLSEETAQVEKLECAATCVSASALRPRP
jgi:hypothetical protein